MTKQDGEVTTGNSSSEEVEWETWNADDVARAGEDADDDSGDFIKIAPGANVFRFLPPLKGKPKYTKVLQHYVPEMGGRKGFSAICTMQQTGRCDVCSLAHGLVTPSANHRPTPVDEELANRMRPTTKYIYAVSKRKASGEPGPAKLLSLTPGVHQSLAGFQGNGTIGGDFTRPDADGYDVIITKKGSGLNTEYEVNAARRNSPLSTDPAQLRAVILGQPDPRPYTLPLTAQELAKKLGQAAPMAAVVDSPRLPAGEAAPAQAPAQAPRRVGDDLENWTAPGRRGK